MRIEMREATLTDAIALAPRLREADKAELRAIGHVDLEEALRASFEVSEVCYALMLDGDLIGIQGIAPGICEGHGAIWALGTDRVREVPRDIYEMGFKFTDLCLEKHKAVGNMVHADNRVHIRWLRRIGYSFLREIQFNNNNFYEFIKVKKIV